MKKLITLILAAVMVAFCCACGSQPENTGEYDGIEKYIEEKYSRSTPMSERQYIAPAANDILEDLFSQSDFYTVLFSAISKADFKDLGKFAYKFGFKEFYDPIVEFIKGEPEEKKPKDPQIQKILENLQEILSKLDNISANQEKMMTELKEVAKQVECEQLDTVINGFQQLLTNNLAPQTIYRAIRRDEEDAGMTDEERNASIMSDLLGGMGFGQDYRVYNRTDVAFDNYTYQLGKAITGPYRVTFKSDAGLSNEQGNIFWVYYELKRREVDWEHRANEDRASFHVDLLSQYLMAATVDLQSLRARIAAIKEYNDSRAEGAPYVSDSNVKEMIDLLTTQMKEIGDLAAEWDVQPHDYRFFWVPGHEIKIVTDVKCGNFREKHTENKNAGIDDQLALTDPDEYFKDYMRYDETHPLISGQALADLYKYAGQSGRLNAYKSDSQPFWKWLKEEGGLNIDAKVEYYVALSAPITRQEGPEHSTSTGDWMLKQKDLSYAAFTAHPLALTDARYYGSCNSELVYGIIIYNYLVSIAPSTFDYSPDNFDNHNFMIVGTVEE